MKGSKIKPERKLKPNIKEGDLNRDIKSPVGADAGMQTEENESIDELDEEDDFGNFFSRPTNKERDLDPE